MPETLLAFDFGLRHIGVAVGQSLTGTARPLAALKAQDGAPDWQQLARLLQEWQPDALLVGLPLNMDGSEQPLSTAARRFARRLEGRFSLPVRLQDERLSTVEAKQQLFDAGGYRALAQKGQIDSAAAALLLQAHFADRAPHPPA